MKEPVAGTLVYIMGPSGSGKDSLIEYARRSVNRTYAQTWNAAVNTRQGLRPVFFARRYITRPAGTGGERHYSLTREAFQLRKSRGEFSLSWESHGLCYGIGDDIDACLTAGAVVVVNGSREYLPEALKLYPELVPVLISARPEVLRERLEKRGREKQTDIDERLAGAGMKLPEISGFVRVDNSGSLAEAGRFFLGLFHRLRYMPAIETKK
ncbi:MAG: phosphonate metabolism protein/1,5-bisphosphokinase (PRPP-forming) PhnN [Desulfovibrionaceae bacterium]|nr:phosphonate metabolism protein/1,5-bisphosphokinase (PRPP-forming) PhnN [Desulfovibrionaceae bacterium]